MGRACTFLPRESRSAYQDHSELLSLETNGKCLLVSVCSPVFLSCYPLLSLCRPSHSAPEGLPEDWRVCVITQSAPLPWSGLSELETSSLTMSVTPKKKLAKTWRG